MTTSDARPLPLDGITVIEFSQLVMGPTCGMILADLGANIIKVEPPGGERSRRMGGVAAGFFTNYNRNKRSVAIDTATPDGQAIAKRLVASGDVLIENFRPGMMARFGLDYDAVAAFAPHVIYCSLKGFLPGPYENRTALDEVVQIMAGLAYMTGPPGKPMRAGASVNDIMGGMFGVIGILSALRERDRTGRGQSVQSALFETCVFLMGQAMMFEATTGERAVPWSVRGAPWPIYNLFDTADGKKMFLAVVGEHAWADFCRAFGFDAWLTDPDLATKDQRDAAHDRIVAAVAAEMAQRPADEIAAICDQNGIGYAPLGTPTDLPGDPHLNASGGLHDVRLADGRHAKAPAVPLSMNGERLPKRLDPPAAGADTAAVLTDLGLNEAEIADLCARGIIGQPEQG